MERPGRRSRRQAAAGAMQVNRISMTIMAVNSSKSSDHMVLHLEEQPLDKSMDRKTLNTALEVEDEEQLDYSFALEYRGPPVNHPVPKAAPLDARLVGPRDNKAQEPDTRSRLAKLKPPPLEVTRRTGLRLAASPGSGETRGLSISQREGPEPGPSPLRDSEITAELPDSPDSISLRLMSSGGNLFSRQSSSSEIEELNVQFSAAVSAAASAFPSPSVLRSVSVGANQVPEASENHSTPRSMSLSRLDRVEAVPRSTPPQMKEPAMVKKKRECHRCHRRHLLQEKETCLVCTARYCRSCVLEAMGAMPEGRKCLGCEGQPIHESRRSSLGKPSKLLKNILDPLEVQQLMRIEKECPANRLRPEQLFVNGRALTAQGMSELLGCSNPPSKLKPARYWYDKSSGFWGKEGEKPSQIITAELKVGGDLQPTASNGSTQVYINGREVTKSELKMLKLAGVQCPQTTYLFLFPDGSYMEEGQNNVKGNIWSKASIRMMYSFFSLPTPRGRVSSTEARQFSSRYLPSVLEPKSVNKLLLLGHEGSGRSAVFKQAKFLYKNGFTRDELERYKEMIQSYLYKYLVSLLEGRERFEEEENEAVLQKRAGSGGPVNSSEASGEKWKNIYSLDMRLKNLADWFLDITADGSLESIFPAATREYAASVEELWHDPAIQATYKRKEELHMLPDVAGDFLERAVELSSNEYEPVDHDVLYAEGLIQGSGLAEIEFELPDREQISGIVNDAADYQPSSRYQLIRVGGIGFNEGRKWLGMFEDVRAVIFVASLSDFDQLWMDSNGVLRKKMLLSKELFIDIAGRQCFKGIPLVLFLNKYDKFEEKIAKGIPLTTCEWFSDFSPVGVPLSVQAQQAYTYIVHKFKKLVPDRKVYTYQLNALDRNLVASAFQYVKHILKHEESKAAGWMMLPEDSSFCTDMSSYSLHSTVPRQENGVNSWERSPRHST